MLQQRLQPELTKQQRKVLRRQDLLLLDDFPVSRRSPCPQARVSPLGAQANASLELALGLENLLRLDFG